MYQWRIQDFLEIGANSQSGCANLLFFAENCVKLKEFGPPLVPGAPSWIRQYLVSKSDLHRYFQ